MRNLLALASVAAVALVLAVGGADASTSPVKGNPPSGTGLPSGGGTPTGGGTPPGNGGTACTVLCFNLPLHRLDLHSYQVCSDKLTQLGRVTVREIEGVNDYHKVHVVPICDTTTNHSLTQPEQAYLSRGNVQGLLPAIAANDVLVSKLGQDGYKTNDVLGVQYASNATLLYVTHR